MNVLGRSRPVICLCNNPASRKWHLPQTPRFIATHVFYHHAEALSILPSNVNKTSPDFKENAAQMGELMARMQELHKKIEAGGPEKAREKHIARGKMLPREYGVKQLCASISETDDSTVASPPSLMLEATSSSSPLWLAKRFTLEKMFPLEESSLALGRYKGCNA